MPNRSSRRPNCCCRSAFRARSPRRGLGRRRSSRRRAPARPIPPAGARSSRRTNPIPSTLLLSNGRYAVMLTAAGSGYSRWGDMAITRWREDATRDDSGSYIFLRDMRSGAVWSAGFQPTGAEPDEYSVLFNEDRAEFTRRDGALTTTLDVLVSAEDDAEVRRVTITNAGVRTREIEITSYAELSARAAERRHRASRLRQAVRRDRISRRSRRDSSRRDGKRTPTEPEIWAAHLSVANGEAVGKPEFETDRARFLGRGHGVDAPIAMLDARPLIEFGRRGARSDLRAAPSRQRSRPARRVRVAFWTMAAATRAALLDQHRQASRRRGLRAGDDARLDAGAGATASSRRQAGRGRAVSAARRATSSIASPALRPSSDTIRQGSGPQSGLWSQGISGDLPIVLLRIAEIDNLDVVAPDPARRTNIGG